MEYLFLLASLIAVFGMSLASNKMTNNLAEGQLTQQKIQSIQTKFFISAAVVELLPIVLIVLAFADLETGSISSIHMYIAIALIVLIWIITLVKMFFKGQETIKMVDGDSKQQVTAAVYIAIAFMSGIPIASIFMLLNL